MNLLGLPFILYFFKLSYASNVSYIHVFSRKSQKVVTVLAKTQEISALEANINSFQQISIKYLPFPHPDISLMTKIWLKGLHLFQYIIGDAETLAKLK